MFLIRRKSDGKFWRNLNYHQSRRGLNWQETSNDIIPFRTTVGARNAMQRYCFIPYRECEALVDHHCRWPFCSRHKKVLTEVTKERFDAQFELVPVSVEVASDDPAHVQMIKDRLEGD